MNDSTAGATRVLRAGRVLAIALTAVFCVLLMRVVQLQTSPAEPIAALLDSQGSTARLMGRRGELVDRRGRPLATTRVARRLFVDPALIVDRGSFSERVAYRLGYDPAWVERTISSRSRSRYVVLDHRLSDARVARLHELDLPGLATESVLVRDYPHGRLAGHLVGFVGRDGDGLEGLERLFNDRLKPRSGSMRYLRDARRQPLWIESAGYQPHEDGQSVRLSIDLRIQSIAEQHLEAAVKTYRAKAGQLIVMDPHTGEILAMVNYPSFDPERFASLPAEQRRNRAVADVFEPGSIFKPFIWAAITELGAMRPQQMVDCTDAAVWYTPYGRRLRDAKPKGVLTWNEVLIQSSNIGMAKAAEKITIAQLHDIVRSFGFGRPTGSGLPGEIGGLVHPLPRWNRYSQSSIPMGQEIGVTALQITRAFCVFANDGLLVTPTVEHVRSNNERPMIQQRVLSRAIIDHTRYVMRRTVTEGNGRKANSKLYALFGKTGTAQLPDFDNGGYHEDQYVSSFIGGAPYDQPRLVVGCFIHQPDKSVGHYGGTVAAPTVMAVMEQSLLYQGVSPHQPDDATQQTVRYAYHR